MTDSSTESIDLLRQHLMARAMEADELPVTQSPITGHSTGGVGGGSPTAFFRSTGGRTGSFLPRRAAANSRTDTTGGAGWRESGVGYGQTEGATYVWHGGAERRPSPVGALVSRWSGRGKGLTTSCRPVFMPSPSIRCGALLHFSVDVCSTPPFTTPLGFATAVERPGCAGTALPRTENATFGKDGAFAAFNPCNTLSNNAHDTSLEDTASCGGAAVRVTDIVTVDLGDEGGRPGGGGGDDAGGQRVFGGGPNAGAGSAGKDTLAGSQGTAVDMQWTAFQSQAPSVDACAGMADNGSSGEPACNVDMYMHVDVQCADETLSGDTVRVHQVNMHVDVQCADETLSGDMVRVHQANGDCDATGACAANAAGSRPEDGGEPVDVHCMPEGCYGSNEPQSSQGETTRLGDDGSQGAAPARPRGSWAHLDTMALIRAKGNRYVARVVNSEDMGNGRTSKKTWEEIASALTAGGFAHTWLECRTRWRTIWSTYRQVTALHRGSGVQSYWRMAAAKRVEKGFNFILLKECFDLLEVFFWDDPSVHPRDCEDPGTRFEECRPPPAGGAPGGGAAAPGSGPREGAAVVASDGAAAEGAHDSDPSPSYKKSRTPQNARDKSFKELGCWMREQTGALKHHTDATLQCAQLTVSAIDRQSSIAAAVQ
ncbi:hypothetical protein CBR_g8065 [Chara braunii]|uniref:Myb-like domain-containing protein n=1 Tax=Chara braunii TaxID=69332 RepID=A0A388KL56_CHABU|nr:hypothetical protein CBR_g8065 [Chara braunii]|eukprot:GBG70767.1 hypothetical protein CBR_g8065 [Chara braunii]